MNPTVLSKPEKPRQRLKDILASVLSPEEKTKLVSSFDSLGNIAILEIPRELQKKEKQIAQALLDANPRFETIAKKTGAHKGKFRVEPVKVLAGKKNLTALYRESGCAFRIHLGKVFFSPRLGTERLRIAQLIQPEENVGVFFAGVGPFAIVFAKHSRLKQAIGIELNPAACKDFEFNITQNRMKDRVQCIKGDVKKIVSKKFRGAFDRIAMPLPKGAADFLDSAFTAANPKGCTIHFYAFVPVNNPFSEVQKHITRAASKKGFSIRFLHSRVVRSFSKETAQAVFDFQIKKKKDISKKKENA